MVIEKDGDYSPSFIVCRVDSRINRVFLAIRELPLRYFALCSVVDDLVVFFINQIAYKYKLVSFVFKTFSYIWERGGCVVGIVVKQHNRAVFNLFCHPVANSFGCCAIFPIERVNVPLNRVHIKGFAGF